MTHLMVAMLRYLVIHQGVSVRFVKFMGLLADLRATFNGEGSTSQVISPLIEVPVRLPLGDANGRETLFGRT